MEVTITTQPALRIAGIRHIGPYHEIGREFGRLGGLLKGPPPAGSRMIALFTTIRQSRRPTSCGRTLHSPFPPTRMRPRD